MIEAKPLPMKEAQTFWADKVHVSPSVFKQLEDNAKTRAFAISGIAVGDELGTAFNALRRHLDDGVAFGEFKKDCKEIFESRGWKGHRIATIFRTNIQTAYQSGRYEQMKRVTALRPFWQYDAVGDKRTRPTHAALDGKIFRADDPFWDTWYPPSGYNCRCSVNTLSERQVKTQGLTVETENPTGKMIEPVDPDTGKKLPKRPLVPDKGFSHHSGKSMFGGIVDAAEKPGKWADMQGLKGPVDYRRATLKNVQGGDVPDLDESALLPSGKSDGFYKNEFLSRYGEERVLKDVLGDPVILSLRSFLVDKTPGATEEWKFKKSGHGESIPFLESMAAAPYEVWLTPQVSEDGKIRLSRRYVCPWKTKDKKRLGGIAVYEIVGGVFQGVTNFMPFTHGKPNLKYLERQRRGLMLYGK